MRRAQASVLLFSIASIGAATTSCRSCEEPKNSPTLLNDAETREAAAGTSPPDASPLPTSPDPPRDAAATTAALTDAGASSCRLAYGPAEQPFRGPAALAVTPRELQLVVNDSGKPRIYPLPLTPPPGKSQPPVVPPRPSSFVGMRWPPCELAGKLAYCQGTAGAITRTTLGATDGKTVAKSKPGSRFAAAALGAEHAVVAYLDTRYTTEGTMLQAFVALDDNAPQRLSDDGAGATALRFVPRADHAVAVYIDARTAMVPVHARAVRLHDADIALGPDTVMFVGGAPERGIDFTVAEAGPKGFALLPIPHETLDFGVAAVPIEDPPKEDVPPVWSFYPNGLDPAPIAAAKARDGKSAWVVRLRPRDKAVPSPKVLELGRLDGAGIFSSLGEIAAGVAVSDAALVEDGSGAVWITYGDSKATWLERRVCDGT